MFHFKCSTCQWIFCLFIELSDYQIAQRFIIEVNFESTFCIHFHYLSRIFAQCIACRSLDFCYCVSISLNIPQCDHTTFVCSEYTIGTAGNDCAVRISNSKFCTCQQCLCIGVELTDLQICQCIIVEIYCEYTFCIKEGKKYGLI